MSDLHEQKLEECYCPMLLKRTDYSSDSTIRLLIIFLR